MEITVRSAKEHDAAALALLLTELGYPHKPEAVVAKLETVSSKPTFRVLVAEVEGSVCGMIAFDVQPLFHQSGNIGTIMALVVSNDFRGRGIGRALVHKIENIAKEAGCIKIAVASGVHRKEAHRFYYSLGYQENTKRFVKVFTA